MDQTIIINKIKRHIRRDIISCIQLTKGSYNQIYKIVTNNRNYLLRIYASGTWPEKGKLEFIENKLIENNILTARNIFITRDNDTFIHGYMIEEYLEGEVIQDVINKKITEHEYYTKLGKLMRRIHAINIKNYGYIGSGVANHTSFTSFLNRELESVTDDFLKLNVFSSVKFEHMKKIVIEKSSSIDNLPAVLVHNDVSCNNIMLVDGELILIDWDNAISSNWIQDYSCMTYWMYWSEKNRNEVIRKKNIFLESYNPEFSIKHLGKYEKANHLLMSLKLLLWYKDRVKEFNKVLEYINELYELLE